MNKNLQIKKIKKINNEYAKQKLKNKKKNRTKKITQKKQQNQQVCTVNNTQLTTNS